MNGGCHQRCCSSSQGLIARRRLRSPACAHPLHLSLNRPSTLAELRLLAKPSWQLYLAVGSSPHNRHNHSKVLADCSLCPCPPFVQDIEPTWSSILKILDYSTGLARFAGPGAWLDPDMLEGKTACTRGLQPGSVCAGQRLPAVVSQDALRLSAQCPRSLLPISAVGNGLLTLGEQRAHFALWALLKSPLLIGADLRTCAAPAWAAGAWLGCGAASRPCLAPRDGAVPALTPPCAASTPTAWPS